MVAIVVFISDHIMQGRLASSALEPQRQTVHGTSGRPTQCSFMSSIPIVPPSLILFFDFAKALSINIRQHLTLAVPYSI